MKEELDIVKNNLEDKLKVLKINDKRVSEIKNMVYKPFEQDRLEKKGFKKNQIICLNKLVGMHRWDSYEFNNWIDVLDSLHKMRNFNIYSEKSFEKIIEKPPEYDNTPQVILYDGEFYIDGEGKHRLTIAKCLGLKKATVDVKYF